MNKFETEWLIELVARVHAPLTRHQLYCRANPISKNLLTCFFALHSRARQTSASPSELAKIHNHLCKRDKNHNLRLAISTTAAVPVDSASHYVFSLKLHYCTARHVSLLMYCPRGIVCMENIGHTCHVTGLGSHRSRNCTSRHDLKNNLSK